MTQSIFTNNLYSYFIHSDHFYSASSSPLLLRSTPDTAQILCRSFKPKSHKQLRVKDLPKVPLWRLERNSNPRPSLPMSHHIPQILGRIVSSITHIQLNSKQKLVGTALALTAAIAMQTILSKLYSSLRLSEQD